MRVKAAKNSIIGYSYQKLVAFYFLAIMDVEREFNGLEIEADVDHNFDDLVLIKKDGSSIYCQMKDFHTVKISDIKVDGDNVKIKSSPHKFSNAENVIFIKSIDLEPNSSVMGFPSYFKDNVHIVSISREEIRDKLESLYEIDRTRMSLIETFFERRFDERTLVIAIHELPPIQIYSTELIDSTLEVQKIEIDENEVIFVEGKPGIGKSHLVNNLEVKSSKIIYRFWISNQDPQYQDRLRYDNFISNITKELFSKLAKKSLDEIAFELNARSITLVIDGLDHVENYNSIELRRFIEFINILGSKDVKVIVFSRPLRTAVEWKKYKLHNWNNEQTSYFLAEQYHLSEYKIIEEIYRITQGYPILVRFLANHYKEYKVLPELPQLKDLNEYYELITNNYSNKESLAIFLTSNSYFMCSEFDDLLGTYGGVLIKQIIKDHPYLFEIKLNRITLMHDSLNTYLRINLYKNETVEEIIQEIKRKVYNSILLGEKRYISRYNFFEFSHDEHVAVIKKYADIDFFDEWIQGTVDIEAIQEFYKQLRHSLNKINPNSLTVYNYYDLSIIINILVRDHISSLKQFLYVYVNTLLFNGYSEEDVTSSGYLFGMLDFVLEGNYKVLENVTSDDYYDTRKFYNELLSEIEEEDKYFYGLYNPINFKNVEKVLLNRSEFDFRDILIELFIGIYIHKVDNNEKFQSWKIKIHDFIDNKEDITFFVEAILLEYGHKSFFAHSILSATKYKLKTLGLLFTENEFLNFTMEEFIEHFNSEDSYNLLSYIKDYFRLSLFRKTRIDVPSVYKLFTSYYARKDYTVNNIGKTLLLFQRKGYLEIEKSVEIIDSFQSKSEKGIRHILDQYVEMLNSEEYMYFIKNIYLKNSELKLNIFHLTSEKINLLNDEMVWQEFYELIDAHNYSKMIEYFDLESLLYSRFSKKALSLLLKYNYKILLKSTSNLEIFNGEYESLIQLVPENDFGSKKADFSNYENGYLSEEDREFIISQGLSPVEIASLPDGFYSAFSELELYRHFERIQLEKDLCAILHAAICSKIYSIDKSSNLFEMTGNVPVFLEEFVQVDIDFKKLFRSFSKFIKLSGVN
ncbi:hypothetical protein [Psychrobacillus soli]|uniref:Uncharacterized protein n=1 Tax=Psychrobacillus soli TaxID=1543965 RepID=A0A544TB89_9BACI|nr:hypothetical protein [Psychrobacillus soli]TQR14732.1 hypothetical protein FG383_10450 [Psychrobacillus soli]